MFNFTFSNLAGVLCAGYFIHQFSLPIISKAANPEKNIRNVFLGYTMVLMTYMVVGCMGYIAFSGESFKEHFLDMSPKSSSLGLIEQNFLNMYRYDQVPAIFIRCLIYIQLSCSYPLVNHFQRTVLFNLFFGTTDVTDK